MERTQLFLEIARCSGHRAPCVITKSVGLRSVHRILFVVGLPRAKGKIVRHFVKSAQPNLQRLEETEF